MISKQTVQINNRLKPEPTEGFIEIESWDLKERQKRATKWSLMFFGFGIVSVLVPIFHFILVPGFIISSPIAYFFFMRQQSMIIGGEGVCPNCLQTFKIARSSNKIPMDDKCDKCNGWVRITSS
jgi:hypothetical protein